MQRKREREQREKTLNAANEDKMAQMRQIYNDLKLNMSKYSSQYENQIRNNKEVRAKFINICNKIGIDPIVSKRSMWGMLGDFYNQISIQILRICEKTKELNGGLLKIQDLLTIFNRTYPSNQIDRNDVAKAVENIMKLGNGCKIVDNTYISTVPFELSNDQVSLMKMADVSGFVSENIAR
jgi:ESCRT-II complex subunit VPS22